MENDRTRLGESIRPIGYLHGRMPPRSHVLLSASRTPLYSKVYISHLRYPHPVPGDIFPTAHWSLHHLASAYEVILFWILPGSHALCFTLTFVFYAQC